MYSDSLKLYVLVNYQTVVTENLPKIGWDVNFYAEFQLKSPYNIISIK